MESTIEKKADLDVIWGGEAIAREIGRKSRITFHMLEKGEIPGARKVCGRWCITRQKLREAFGLEDA
ncbi:MAG: DNA-binding protein [Pseudomonadota bacterium]|nr:DNA-binding protein [Pseudomonadota bacterium]